jgi:hypothetical protein
MARLGTSRRSFNPEALSQIALIVDDVLKELAQEGADSLNTAARRNYVARKIFHLAQAKWTAIQIKQLLLRSVRNEISLQRRKSSRKSSAPLEATPPSPIKDVGQATPLSPQAQS